MDWLLRIELALGHGADDSVCTVKRGDLARLLEHYRETENYEEDLDAAESASEDAKAASWDAGYAEGLEDGRAQGKTEALELLS